MTYCRRCGRAIKWEGKTWMDEYAGVPHKATTCNTRPGYIWCPSHYNAFPRDAPCSHYRQLGYKKGESEKHFIFMILYMEYKDGQQAMSPHTRKPKKSTCTHCKKDFDGFDPIQQKKHIQECIRQMHLESFV